MTELSFLVDLLLNHKLNQNAKGLVACRIKELSESRFSEQVRTIAAPVVSTPATIQQAVGASLPPQSASTLAAMARHAAERPNDPTVPFVPPQEVRAPEVAVPVKDIAKTPEAAMAMMDRNAVISAAISGKPAVFSKKGEQLTAKPRLGR